MRNKLIIALIMVAIVLGICAFEMMTINNVASESSEIIETMLEAEENDDKNKLENTTNQLYELWQSKTPLILMFIQHETIGEIEQSVAIIKSSVENEDFETFHSEVVRAELQIHNLRDTEFPYLQNIL